MTDEPTIVLVGDIHVSDTPPANCTESYTDDIIAMLGWAADHAHEIGADAVVWAGDVFHHKAPSRNSHALVLKMIEIVKHHEALGIPLWIVPGNHDLSNDVLDTLHTKQPLGVLYAAGARLLDGWHPSLPLYGIPWRQDWTTNPDAPTEALEDFRERGGVSGLSFPYSLAESLVVTHAPIYPPAMVERGVPFDLVSTSDLAEAMNGRGYLHYGHIHEDHGIFTDGGVTFANVGALSRGSLHEYNIEREIKILDWAPAVGFVEVPVPHKPASEAFRLVEALAEKDKRLDLDAFLANVGTSRLDIAATGSVIAAIRERTDIPEDVKARAVTFLEEADR